VKRPGTPRIPTDSLPRVLADRSGRLAFRTSEKARADELAWRIDALR
jgi:hypothetical protein